MTTQQQINKDRPEGGNATANPNLKDGMLSTNEKYFDAQNNPVQNQ